PAGPLELTMETYTAGGGGYFTLQGQSQRNPTIRAAPGQTVIITIVGTDNGVHNICIPPRECTAFVTAPGETQTLTFTAPESGTIEYYCAPHRAAGMRGNVAIGAPGGGDGGQGGGDEGTITGATIDLGQYSPACQGKVAPAIVTQGIVGAPTLQDYIDACTPQEGEVEVAKHGADLVIPISWALIGLGVFGVVWVHKYYRP
ncbi:MAG TPA: plastocyanin/azurin family copper-binding protein, partial [Candidatus Thermoplasmatota archaeon]|nr:plastocyanin/azurin family copper-binding protein [Candidatus Thermoplasmatota archaeon]